MVHNFECVFFLAARSLWAYAISFKGGLKFLYEQALYCDWLLAKQSSMLHIYSLLAQFILTFTEMYTAFFVLWRNGTATFFCVQWAPTWPITISLSCTIKVSSMSDSVGAVRIWRSYHGFFSVVVCPFRLRHIKQPNLAVGNTTELIDISIYEMAYFGKLWHSPMSALKTRVNTKPRILRNDTRNENAASFQSHVSVNENMSKFWYRSCINEKAR